MSTPGRGRSDGSKKYQAVEKTRPSVEEERPEEASTSSLAVTEPSIPTRPRGGFKQVTIRTRPTDTLEKRAEITSEMGIVDLIANYVPIESKKSELVQSYRVDFEPPVESESLMRHLFKSAVKGLFRLRPIYDGVHECRSGQKLENDVTTVDTFDSKTEQKYIVKFTNTGTCSHGPEMTRIYNMQIKEFLREDLGFYSPQTGLFVHPAHSQTIAQDIMMLRGYRTSANMHEDNKVLMNLEACHKLVQRSNVLEIMDRKTRENPSGNIKSMLRDALVGKIVVTSYNKCCYRIEDIDFDTNPTSTFDLKGTPTSFVDFYRTRYDKPIRNLTQSMLKVVPNRQRRREPEQDSKVILLVPELCNIAGLTEDQKKDPSLKFKLIQGTQVDPRDRVKHLREFLESFHGNRNVQTKLGDWGYSYGKEPISIKAHVIPMTKYSLGVDRDGAQKYQAASDSADFNVNRLAVAPPIHKLAILIPKNELRNKRVILPRLQAGFERVGLALPRYREEIDMPGDSPSHFANAIANLAPDTTMAIVLMQRQNKDCYDAIKKAASCSRGLITQVVTSALMTKDGKFQSAAAKIAIQIAAKVGGEPWFVNIPMADTMICGYDTYHDTLKAGRSFGAFVASLNAKYSKWWSKADAHERLEEISTQMSVNLKAALKAYLKLNGKLPSKVIIYRDGVGDGQLEHVFRVELSKIQEELAKVPTKIALTMIVVNKRIGARFYMRNRDGIFNPKPGTVVDHTVTREERYDFYLISQSTRQGTVTPTYYNIIHDESDMPVHIQQFLAFKLCLLYYNWSGTVRVPAPCQYAHKLALLCGEHLHNQPNARLDEKLHFL